jgi:hypothetical protein
VDIRKDRPCIDPFVPGNEEPEKVTEVYFNPDFIATVKSLRFPAPRLTGTKSLGTSKLMLPTDIDTSISMLDGLCVPDESAAHITGQRGASSVIASND